MIDISKYEELPYRMSRAQYITDKYGSMWNLRKFDGWRNYEGKISPYNLSIRIIENNIGKSFALAFSYYCKLINKRYQKIFLEEFYERLGWRASSYNDYYIDINGLIQRTQDNYSYKYGSSKYKGPYIFRSIDYKSELRHKISKKSRSEHYVFNKNYKESDYEYTVTNGFALQFDSKNDRLLKRLKAEKQKEYNKRLKNRKKELKNMQYNFLTKQEKDIIKSRKEDLIKIQSHGFDPINSFRKDKEIN